MESACMAGVRRKLIEMGASVGLVDGWLGLGVGGCGEDGCSELSYSGAVVALMVANYFEGQRRALGCRFIDRTSRRSGPEVGIRQTVACRQSRRFQANCLRTSRAQAVDITPLVFQAGGPIGSGGLALVLVPEAMARTDGDDFISLEMQWIYTKASSESPQLIKTVFTKQKTKISHSRSTERT